MLVLPSVDFLRVGRRGPLSCLFSPVVVVFDGANLTSHLGQPRDLGSINRPDMYVHAIPYHRNTSYSYCTWYDMISDHIIGTCPEASRGW